MRRCERWCLCLLILSAAICIFEDVDGGSMDDGASMEAIQGGSHGCSSH